MFERLNNKEVSIRQIKEYEEAIKRSAEFDISNYTYQGNIREDIKREITNNIIKEPILSLKEPCFTNFFILVLFNEIPENIEQIIKHIKTDMYVKKSHRCNIEYYTFRSFLAEVEYYPEFSYKRAIYEDLLKEDIVPHTAYIYSVFEVKKYNKTVKLNRVLAFEDSIFGISGYIKDITKKSYDTCFCINKETTKNWNKENKNLIHSLMLNLSKDIKVLKDIYIYKSTSLTDYTFKKWIVERNTLYFEVDGIGVWSGYIERFEDYVKALIQKYKNIVIDYQCYINEKYFYIYFNPLIDYDIYKKYLNVWGQG